MGSGKNDRHQLDPLTDWEVAVINLLLYLNPGDDLDVQASRENMLTLMVELDKGRLDSAMSDPGFMQKAEALLLSLLRGEQVEVADLTTFKGRKEIIAAAHVVYNQAVARGFWNMHSEISDAMTSHR